MYSADIHGCGIKSKIENRIELLWQWDGKTCEQLQVGKVGMLVCRVRYCTTYYLRYYWTGPVYSCSDHLHLVVYLKVVSDPLSSK